MPELPDITVYTERLQALAGGQRLLRVRILHPFVLRSALPPIGAAEGCRLRAVERLAKRIVLVLGHDEGRELLLVMHLMLAGRLRWLPPGAKPPGRIALASLEFEGGTLVLTEAGSKRLASLHLLADRAALAAHDPGGLEPLQADLAAFTQRLRSGQHTLKRALTDPALFSGIGNAYSDEILHRARLSPLTRTRSLDEGELLRLFEATQAVLNEWTARLRAEALADGGWPNKVTALRPEMAVHGRYGQPCPVCGAPVQRVLLAEREFNYCAGCQTGGRLLADRVLSRLLKDDRPRTLDDLTG